jgi:4-coumarate--CoA ligase
VCRVNLEGVVALRSDLAFCSALLVSPIISMQTVADLKNAPNSVGVLAPNTVALVLDSDGKGESKLVIYRQCHDANTKISTLLGHTSELGPNEEGELVLHGPQMMKGYFENAEANEKAFYYRSEDDHKWLRTGDVARIDDRGYITITDRLKDVIKAKGFQVSPAEVEAVLFRDDRVADVAVTGLKDPKDGAERPWAFIVAHQSMSSSEEKDQVAKSILEKANAQMAGYKKVEGVTWLDALPKR